jgi:hypothetical protein
VNCPICGKSMKVLLELPLFPLTEKYEAWSFEFKEGRGLVDQAFLYCDECSHGKLAVVVPGLYGSDYLTSTGKSEGAKQAVLRFVSFVLEHCGVTFETLIDIGANDGTFLNNYHTDYGRKMHLRVAVDPHANGDVLAIKKTIEEADLSQFKNSKKVIVSSHTIEHLVDPEVMIAKCAEIMGDDDYLALQFPSLELLVEDARIDQIHHQHIHYFSENSITALLRKHGLIVIETRFDSSHWGALMVVAQKNRAHRVEREKISSSKVQFAIDDFRREVWSTRVPEGALALGAALMLPVLVYWMQELHKVCGIYDEDQRKEGLRYINFNKKIGKRWGYREDVVVTAIGSKAAARALTEKAIEWGAKRIVLPLHTL